MKIPPARKKQGVFFAVTQIIAARLCSGVNAGLFQNDSERAVVHKADFHFRAELAGLDIRH